MGRRGPPPMSEAKRRLVGSKSTQYADRKRETVGMSLPLKDLFKKEPVFKFDDEGVAAAEWKFIKKSLAGVQLADVDRSAIIEWCQNVALRHKAWKMVQREGAVLVDDKGKAYINPWTTIMQRQTQVMLSLSARLGFDAGARANLKGSGSKPEGKFSGLLG